MHTDANKSPLQVKTKEAINRALQSFIQDSYFCGASKDEVRNGLRGLISLLEETIQNTQNAILLSELLDEQVSRGEMTQEQIDTLLE